MIPGDGWEQDNDLRLTGGAKDKGLSLDEGKSQGLVSDPRGCVLGVFPGGLNRLCPHLYCRCAHHNSKTAQHRPAHTCSAVWQKQ